ncbi:hypothetical protein IE53DRAFT_125369 [Violaceomyces palustris]|uniref:Uncharacterized protein n=1 Tax=Violaceomyces palustris TaxID=1673888 RepID=A0ACD0P6U3_9BASI|nr:hypothetical protein IE53DRAFT_125369 [Violaceomyces palustris]
MFSGRSKWSSLWLPYESTSTSSNQLQDAPQNSGSCNVGSRPAKRRFYHQEKHIEIIGGSSTPPPLPVQALFNSPMTSSASSSSSCLKTAWNTPNQLHSISSSSSSCSFSSSTGTSASTQHLLPPEIVSKIVLLYASSILFPEHTQSSPSEQTKSRTVQVLNLACLDSEAYRTIFSYVLLPTVTLRGADQVTAFSRSLQRNFRGFRHMAKARTKSLRIRLDKLPSSLCGQCQQGCSKCKLSSRLSLYDSVSSQADFEKASIGPLKSILSICDGIENLSMECLPRVLDPRLCSSASTVGTDGYSDQKIQQSRKQCVIFSKLCNMGKATMDNTSQVEDAVRDSLVSLRHKLKELSCMLSNYGGDINEKLWQSDKEVKGCSSWFVNPCASSKPSSLHLAKWANLTHLQLHGPRCRITVATSKALGQLPALTHLGLIMPFLVPPSQDRPISEHYAESLDSEQRPNVLQLLASSCERLQILLVVGHELRDYIGCSEKYLPWLRTIRIRSKATADHRNSEEWNSAPRGPLRIQFVTASRKVNGGTCHPTEFSRWMMRRSENQTQWAWEDEQVRESGHPGSYSVAKGLDEEIDYNVRAWYAPNTDEFEDFPVYGESEDRDVLMGTDNLD